MVIAAAIAALVLATFWFAYCVSGIFLLITKAAGYPGDLKGIRIINTVWRVTEYPALVYVIFSPALWAIVDHSSGFWMLLASLLNALAWIFYKDAGDDDWKKRLKRKAKEVVRAVRGRLVVVPQEA